MLCGWSRIALYANSLLLAARKHPNFLQGLQRHLAAFMAEPAAKRYSLPPMPRVVLLLLLTAWFLAYSAQYWLTSMIWRTFSKHWALLPACSC